MKKLIIAGGQGNGAIVAQIVEDLNSIKTNWEILGFLNDREVEPINGYPILGKVHSDTVAPYLLDENVYFFYSLISLKLNFKSLTKLHDLGIPLSRFATLVHPTAVVSKDAVLGNNVCVHALSIIGPNTRVGSFVQIFGQAMLGHNSKVDDFAYVTSNSVVGAYVHLKQGAFLGINSTTLDRVTIGEWSIVGQHSNVIKDVPDYSIVVGNPAREIGRNT